MARFKQGYYKPNNPSKYIGDINKIRYMSSWELSLHTFFDNNTQVIRWGSEPIAIPYIKPTDNKIHRYYPDYYVEYLQNGNIIREIIEVKPDSQTRQSRARNKQNKLYEDIQFAVNTAKWSACNQFCQQHNINFRVLTEKNLYSLAKNISK